MRDLLLDNEIKEKDEDSRLKTIARMVVQEVSLIPKPRNGVDGKSIKGDKGDSIAGEDGYTPIKGVDYFDGEDGEDGYAPVKDIDYFDGKDSKDGKSISGKDGIREYHPVNDIAVEPQHLRAHSEIDRTYYPLVIEQGGVFKGGTSYTGKYALFMFGAKVIPADDAAHELNIVGEQIDGAGGVSIDLVDKSGLTHSVSINYIPPPTTEIVVLSVNSGSGLTQEEHDRLMKTATSVDTVVGSQL